VPATDAQDLALAVPAATKSLRTTTFPLASTPSTSRSKDSARSPAALHGRAGRKRTTRAPTAGRRTRTRAGGGIRQGRSRSGGGGGRFGVGDVQRFGAKDERRALTPAAAAPRASEERWGWMGLRRGGDWEARWGKER